MKIYLIAALKNKIVPEVANKIEKETGHEVFDSWFSPGPDADDYWRDYETNRNRNYKKALKGYAAQHIFSFDKKHLDTSDAAVMLYPAGKSCHLEAGYMVGRGRPVYLILDGEPERFDVMTNFLTEVFYSVDEFISFLKHKEKEGISREEFDKVFAPLLDSYKS